MSQEDFIFSPISAAAGGTMQPLRDNSCYGTKKWPAGSPKINPHAARQPLSLRESKVLLPEPNNKNLLNRKIYDRRPVL